MNSDDVIYGGILIFLLISGGCGFVHTAMYVELKDQAIERNFAQYNPQSGDWEWIETKDK